MSPPSRSTRSRLLLALPAVGYAALILYLSSRPGTEIPAVGVPAGDKLLHVAEYFVYGLLLLIPTWDLGWRGRALSLAVGIAYAAFDESFQTTVPGRFGDATDFAMDVVGLLLAVILAWIVARPRSSSKPA